MLAHISVTQITNRTTLIKIMSISGISLLIHAFYIMAFGLRVNSL